MQTTQISLFIKSYATSHIFLFLFEIYNICTRSNPKVAKIIYVYFFKSFNRQNKNFNDKNISNFVRKFTLRKIGANILGLCLVSLGSPDQSVTHLQK